MHYKKKFYHLISVIGLTILGFLVAPSSLFAGGPPLPPDTAGRIAGRVTNTMAEPIKNVTVFLYTLTMDSAYDNLGYWHWGYDVVTTTDAAGAYQIDGLVPGTYAIAFADPSKVYSFQFFGNSTQIQNAATVEVKSGLTTSNINPILTRGNGYITGRFGLSRDPSLTPTVAPCILANPPTVCPTGKIYLYFHNGRHFQTYDSIHTITSDTFMLTGLAYGRYRLYYEIALPAVNAASAVVYYDFFPQEVLITAEQPAVNLNLIFGIGALRGRVMAADQQPLAGIQVDIYRKLTNWTQADSELPQYFQTVVTNEAGEYEVTDLLAAPYTLRFRDSQDNYALQYYGGITTLKDSTTFHVQSGITTVNTTEILKSGSQLSGKITLLDGMPPSTIYAFDQQASSYIALLHFDGYHWQAIYSFDFSRKDQHFDPVTGDYTFRNLTSGLYAIDYEVDYKNVKYVKPKYFTECCGPLNLNELPADVELKPNQSTQFNVSLDHQAFTTKIHGRVINERGEPVTKAMAWLYKYSAAHAQMMPVFDSWTLTDENGEYLFPACCHRANLEPGIYTLRFADTEGNYAFEYYGNASTLLSATKVEVVTDTVTANINATLSPAGYLNGTAKLLNGEAITQHEIFFHNGYTWESVFEPNWMPVAVTPTGQYSIGGLATGQYRILFRAEKEVRYIGYYPNATTLAEAEDIRVTAGGTTYNIDMVVIEPAGKNQRVLALYALALDHDPDRSDNLAPQLAPAMQSIIAATRDQPNKTAVVLADAAGVGDTRIYVVRNGRATPVQGLPTAALQLDPTATEANMADGATLGNFIRWARNTYPAEVTLFGFVGHGAPLVPATGFAEIGAASGGVRLRTVDSLFPLPTRVGAYPSLTDNHPQALITPYDLATALRIGANNGADPLQIADVAHCFAASIEELYELSPNGDQPYAEIILASPTYTYLDPPALGEALGAINTLMTPATMADQILQRYDALIDQADQSDGDAEVEHPRLLVAVNSRQVARVKQDWDKVAYHLLQNFDATKLRQAYQASPHYDTTVCHPQDWSLSPPDALADLYGFAGALVTVYGADSAVGEAATVVLRDLEDTAILSRYQRNGIPWYAPSGAPLWNFDNHQGIALFADLQGQPTAQAGTVELSWQSRWYTADALAGENPHPYAFIQNGFHGVTWATVFAEFWRHQPGVAIQTALCFPELASEPQTGELELIALSDPLTGTVRVGLPFTPTAVVQTDRPTLKPTVRFNLYNINHTLLLSDTVQGGYWLTGTHQLAATRPYTPTAPGDLTLEVIVDPANNVSEANEADNHLSQRYTVAPPERFPLVISAQLAEPTFFVNQAQVELHALVSPAESATTLVAQLYQFTNSRPSAPWQATLSALQTLDLTKPTLALNSLSPGVVVAHIWARTAQGHYSAHPAVVIFNYAPANQPLAAGQTHHYWLATPLATPVQLDLAVSGDVDLFAWSPFNGWGPEWRVAGSPLLLPASALTDGYLVAVTTFADSHYTLTAQPTAATPTTANATPELSQNWPAARPRFVQPVIDPPGIGALVAGRQFFLPLTAR